MAFKFVDRNSKSKRERERGRGKCGGGGELISLFMYKSNAKFFRAIQYIVVFASLSLTLTKRNYLM